MKTPAAIYATRLYSANAFINKPGQSREFDNDKFKALINNCSDLMWIVNLDMQMIMVNKSFAEAVTQAIGRTDQILSPLIGMTRQVNL